MLGVLDVSVNGRVLTALLIAEIAVVVAFGLGEVAGSTAHPAAAAFDPRSLLGNGVGALLVMAVTGFVGFEQTVVFSAELREPRSSVPRATFVAIAVIGGVYAFASWAMISAAGWDVVARARSEGPELFFNVASARFGTAALGLGHLLFLTSLIAAMFWFHNVVARYAYSLGRGGVLPHVFRRTSSSSGAPIIGSLAQSCLGLIVLVVFAVIAASSEVSSGHRVSNVRLGNPSRRRCGPSARNHDAALHAQIARRAASFGRCVRGLIYLGALGSPVHLIGHVCHKPPRKANDRVLRNAVLVGGGRLGARLLTTSVLVVWDRSRLGG